MAVSTAVLTPNPFPKGFDMSMGNLRVEGTLAISAGTYPGGGPVMTIGGSGPYTQNTPFGAQINSLNGFQYAYNPATGGVHIYETAQFPAGFPPAVAAGDFAASGGWGTSPTLAPSVGSNQAAFSLTITAQATTTANPTITLTFPSKFATVPVFVCSRGDSLADAGYWVFTSSTTSTAVFTFIGTPTATHVYVLNAYGQSPSQSAPALTTAAIAASSGWGTTPTLALTATSVQSAFVLTVTAQATTAANPTITLTYPTPYSTAPVFDCSRADALADAGYWVVTSNSTTAAVFTFVGTPTATHVYKLAAVAKGSATSTAVTSSAFAASANFGTAPTIAASGSQAAFDLTVTAQATTGANPTITLTFPTPLGTAPNFVASRTDALSDAGYWVVTSTSTTTAVFTFVGTPTATHTYGLSAVSQTYSAGVSELPTGATIPAGVVADRIIVEAIVLKS